MVSLHGGLHSLSSFQLLSSCIMIRRGNPASPCAALSRAARCLRLQLNALMLGRAVTLIMVIMDGSLRGMAGNPHRIIRQTTLDIYLTRLPVLVIFLQQNSSCSVTQVFHELLNFIPVMKQHFCSSFFTFQQR